ncbi:Glycosyltransferase involved in cell wall bisynthesis [Flavobacterium fryxellicola]|uniref:glycosyltransferase n=1 Tax=Flavobacterium fryxellicola TaxID=249352 RepID=UPI00090F5E99|nr:glycosyltransferase [Flavobacterium fryxellicola]SHN75981.1 Glycosyltransferase involved in cell wall bisynthesis [Flavobacterium fryxellicola]
MKTALTYTKINNQLFKLKDLIDPAVESENNKTDEITQLVSIPKGESPEILIISSYPPRECGIATYSQDLKNSIIQKFGSAVSVKICALENKKTTATYPTEVKYHLITSEKDNYEELAVKINNDDRIFMVFLEHEFGLFSGKNGSYIIELLTHLKKPVATTFHTILPKPDHDLKLIVQKIAQLSDSIVVMTKNSSAILINDYGILDEKIKVIPHGTHLISPKEKGVKSKIHLENKLVLSTFGLISEDKSIETALEALPQIIKKFPSVIYLIIGKTHPEVVKNEGEKYREYLSAKVMELNIQNNVQFINSYLSLEDLIDYLQQTTIYLFTSKNPNQAVSGTLAYAMACGCPIISTPIPHSKELLEGAGINFDFKSSGQLANAAIKLLLDPKLLKQMRSNALHRINPTAWQNIAISHVKLAQEISKGKQNALKFKMPEISLAHIKRLTAKHGMIQFSTIDIPDLETGYTLDDNARALIAVTKHYYLTGELDDIELINTYLNFILFCQESDGSFLNYVDIECNYFEKNHHENLEDSNGRAIWALGEFMTYAHLFPERRIEKVRLALDKSLHYINKFQSPRAISFAIKGLYHYNLKKKSTEIENLIVALADNLVSKYRGVSEKKWDWYEDYLTYANSLLPEAMLYASMSSGSYLYKDIAKKTFDFLLSIIFKNNQIKVISNQGWKLKGKSPNQFGEQPIDVAYSILALNQFYEIFQEVGYLEKMKIAFSWFLGNNHLSQIVYNPCTGGCYDGLEETHLNLNQGAESTVSYLLARLIFEKRVSPKEGSKRYSDLQLSKKREKASKLLNKIPKDISE